MKSDRTSLPSVLITGGTSGLGFELVKVFARKGYQVIATGRQEKIPAEIKEMVNLKKVDFNNLHNVAAAIEEICRYSYIGIVINNAGIFSSPALILTEDNLEYTFQVNFLCHLLINEIIIRKRNIGQDLVIAAVTSPVYKTVESELSISFDQKHYRRFKTYSESKLFLALMCEHLTDVYFGRGVKVIGFDPGVFSSEIFRMQRKFLRQIYRVAAPFMRHPSRIASGLGDIIERKDIISGSIYDRHGRAFRVPLKDDAIIESFWRQCYDLIEKYISDR